jgi:pyrroloquinoline quinone biosynthesis protein E
MGAPGEHYRQLLASAERARVPLSVQLELTGRCNLSCRHCYLDLAHPPEELATAEWTSLIDDLAALGTLFVSLTGGELFGRRDTFEIAAHARRHGMALTLLTSGTRLSDDDLDRVAALHPLSVELSLYAASADVHDSITRRSGSHAKTLAALEGLAARGVPLVIKTPILAPNADAIEELVALAEELGAGIVVDPMVITRRDGALDPVELRPSVEQVARVLALPALRERGGPLQSPPRGDDDPVCTIARRVAVVLPNGDVMPCSLHPTPAGNIRSASFESIWNDAPLLRSLREVNTGALDETCRTCEQNDSCSRCGALAMLEDGDFFGPSSAACRLSDAKRLAAGDDARAPRSARPTPAPRGLVQLTRAR